MADISRDEFNDRMNVLHKLLDDGFSGVHGRLDRINGRVRDAESNIVVLQTQLAEREKAASKDPAARYTGIGAALAAGGAYLYQFFSK